MDLDLDVAIVGGGASGALVASQLLRGARRPLQIALIERSGEFARGLAYSTTEPLHLLNVPAAKMSALPQEPGHFLAWLRAHDPAAGPDTFAPRRTYRRYLADTLAEAERQSQAKLIRVSGEVVNAQVGARVRLQLSDGTELQAARAVIALGNQPSSNPAVPDGGVYSSGLHQRSPWEGAGLSELPPDAEVLLIGTGLTMVDTAVSLRARGHTGPIHALSRHGLLPQSHLASGPEPLAWAPPRGAGVRALLDSLRSHARGRDWRSVVDGVRPHTQELWLSLPERERRRFIRHVSSYWEVHRHRMAPEVAALVDAMRASGQLRIIAGRLLELRAEGERTAVVSYRPRHASRFENLRVQRIVNCTGPAPLRAAQPALVRALMDQGAVRLDPFGLGLDADMSLSCFDAKGLPQPALSAIGPMLRGTLWETTAIPEIRAQALSLARHALR